MFNKVSHGNKKEVCNTVFKATCDKGHNGEKQSEDFAFNGLWVEATDIGDADEEVGTHSKDKGLHEGVVCFGLGDMEESFTKLGTMGENEASPPDNSDKKKGANEVKEVEEAPIFKDGGYGNFFVEKAKKEHGVAGEKV